MTYRLVTQNISVPTISVPTISIFAHILCAHTNLCILYQLFFVVRAVDGDRGVNNKIQYSITRGGEGVFDIDSNSGIISTTTKLDRESSTNSNSAYIIEIMVSYSKFCQFLVYFKFENCVMFIIICALFIHNNE